MKTLILLFLLSFAFLTQGQIPDTASVRVEIDSFVKLSRSLLDERKLDEAFQVIQRAEEKCLAAFGEGTALYAKVVFKIGLTYHLKGDYPNAESHYLKAMHIQEQTIGKEHLDYASSLNNLGALYMIMGNYEKAEPFLVESKAIREKTLSKDHPDYASSLNNLGNLYNEMGNYEKAEPLYVEANSIREFYLGKEHYEYANCLNNLAILYDDMGNYEKAEPLYLESKSIFEKTLGKENSDYANSLNNLGTLYDNMGNYEKAEPLYLESKSIHEKILGKEHPDYALILNNLGTLYDNMGNYEKAKPLYLEAKSIREIFLGKEHTEYASSLNNLGTLYDNMGNYEKAEPLYLEAKSIREKVLGKEHPDYASSLNFLGGLYDNMGNYEKAEPLYVEAKIIWQKALGKEHPDYAMSLNNLGRLYNKMGNYEKAEPLYLESKSIREKVLGKEHPFYARSLDNLAILYMSMGNYEKAEPLFLEANGIGKTLLVKASRHLSERELLTYTNKFIDKQNQFLSFTQTQSMLSENAFDNSLFYKGFLLNATQQVNRLAQTDSMSTDMFYRLKGYNRLLAIEYAKPLVERDSASVAELEEKANTLEKEMTRSVAGFSEALRQVNWQEVKAVLQPGEAAIELVHYQFNNPDPTDSTMYAALILRPEEEQPQFIPLFEEKQLQQLISGKDQTENISLAYGSRGLTPGKASDLQGLYELCWQAMEAHLKGVNKVYYAPSGLLHRINFNAIPINKEENLSDRFQLVRLSSTRSLVVPDLTKINSNNEAMLYGGIHYELDTMSLAKASMQHELLASVSGQISFTYSDRSLPQRGDNWNFLKGTQQEVTSIDSLLRKSNFSSVLFSAENATEESFKTIGNEKASPRILHLATHGYFFPDVIRRSFSEGGSQALKQEPIFKISDHPMIRSGLILSGGNHAWKNGKPLRPDMEDGILTAYEISQMDLSHTELVVLSACETGLGDIEGNEGVYGLQRAFKIAGAKYLIMSLWQVPDHQTQEFMVTFYRHCLLAGQAGLEAKMTIPEAFCAAQQTMREKYDDPYMWAGFVLVE